MSDSDTPSKNKRSMTGNHVLLPVSRPSSTYEPIPSLPTHSLTLGRGSVIWRIWPAVLLHTCFAAVVVYLSLEGIFNMEIPSVMLTVLGVVIGFVISYRAISGYDRYWAGRTAWGDVIRNSRTLSRLIWFHVPLRLTAKTTEEANTGQVNRPVSELNKVMTEKRMALDLVEGLAIAVKHHLRGETGIYYEDIYQLVRPMHDHFHTADDDHHQVSMASALPRPRKAQQITTHVIHEAAENHSAPHAATASDPIIPPINTYGTFDPSNPALLHPQPKRSSSQTSRRSHVSSASNQSQSRPLLPSKQRTTDGTRVSRDLIPFAGIFTSIMKKLWRTNASPDPYAPELIRHRWKGPSDSDLDVKYRPPVAGGGENLPLAILTCLSEWFSVLEDRGTVPGTSMGSMVGTLSAFEDSLTALERILTTPLPFVYAMHIRHTVWIYLFFLPFQLVSPFGYSTILGVAIAAFIYLGFVAVGEEMEQPFGYDDNDLDLDLFCTFVIHEDIQAIRMSPCLNAYFGPDPHQEHPLCRSLTVSEIVDP